MTTNPAPGVHRPTSPGENQSPVRLKVVPEASARRAPGHLRRPTRAWWREGVADYHLEAHHERLLTMAGEAFDRATEARETIEAEGAYFKDRIGCPKAHPAVAVERDARVLFARLIRELDLDGEPSPDPRPPRRG